MTGRLSTWPVPVAMMGTVAGTEYAFKVINGEVPFDKLDVKVLEQCMSDYAKVAVETNPYVDEAGKKYDNFLFVLMYLLNNSDLPTCCCEGPDLPIRLSYPGQNIQMHNLYSYSTD